jgi:hypothetical protein
MKVLTYALVPLLLSVACWSEQINLGPVATNILPLLGPGGQILQWDAKTFGGSVSSGSYLGSPCGAFIHCYGFNGAQWQFNMTGTMYCKNTCTYNATGPSLLALRSWQIAQQPPMSAQHLLERLWMKRGSITIMYSATSTLLRIQPKMARNWPEEDS